LSPKVGWVTKPSSLLEVTIVQTNKKARHIFSPPISSYYSNECVSISA
jgi:hypothetical protein